MKNWRLLLRVRTVNPDRLEGSNGRKWENKIGQIFFWLSIYYCSLKKYFFCFFYFLFFYFLSLRGFFRSAGIGGHRRKLKAIKVHLKIRWLKSPFWASWFAKLQFIGLKNWANLALSLRKRNMIFFFIFETLNIYNKATADKPYLACNDLKSSLYLKAITENFLIFFSLIFPKGMHLIV